MRLDVALEIQNKAVEAIKAVYVVEFLNSDFDGEWLSLSFDKSIVPKMINAVRAALPGLQVSPSGFRIYIC